MAKQRRASRPIQPKLVGAPPSNLPRIAERGRNPSGVQTPAPPVPRPGHHDAVAHYEQGVAALQEHDYARASSLLRSVVARYPDERELHERVRLYLIVCERHMAPSGSSPSTPEERVFAATLAVNSGNYDEAIKHLRRATDDAPDQDHALYMLATVLTLRDQVDEAVPLLIRAIELNPDNRALARHDPELEALRQFDSVRAALEAVLPSKNDRKKSLRRR